MPKGDSARSVGRGNARRYLAKAQQFHDSAAANLANDRWSAAGLDAIHAGISAADAVVVATTGRRSSSKDHGAAIELLRSSTQAGASQVRQLTGLLAMKNTIEYEERLVTEAEARSLVGQSERLVKWSHSAVEKVLGET